MGVLLCLVWLRDCVVNLMSGWLLREHLTHGNNVLPPIHILLHTASSVSEESCMTAKFFLVLQLNYPSCLA